MAFADNSPLKNAALELELKLRKYQSHIGVSPARRQVIHFYISECSCTFSMERAVFVCSLISKYSFRFTKSSFLYRLLYETLLIYEKVPIAGHKLAASNISGMAVGTVSGVTLYKFVYCDSYNE